MLSRGKRAGISLAVPLGVYVFLFVTALLSQELVRGTAMFLLAPLMWFDGIMSGTAMSDSQFALLILLVFLYLASVAYFILSLKRPWRWVASASIFSVHVLSFFFARHL